jgi:hypothetical protein
MDDEAIRKMVQEGLISGRLPRQISLIAQPLKPGQSASTGFVAGRRSLSDACTVCGTTETQLRFHTSSEVFAFHKRCYAIWKDEAERPIRRER